ncbi:MAG: potassium channel family protein [Xanthobacteraceae bacterium]
MIARKSQHRRERLDNHLLTALTILLSVILFVAAPLQANGVLPASWFGLLFGLLLIPAGFLVSGNRLALVLILVAMGINAVAITIGWRQPSTVDKILDAVSWLIAGLTLGAVVALAVFAPGKITPHRIIGAVLLYLIIGQVFAALIGLVSLLEPNAVTNLEPLNNNFAGNLIYFSLITLTTTGYGDIVPMHAYARGLVNIEAVIGQLYPATLLARLVTLELKSRQDT